MNRCPQVHLITPAAQSEKRCGGDLLHRLLPPCSPFPRCREIIMPSLCLRGGLCENLELRLVKRRACAPPPRDEQGEVGSSEAATRRQQASHAASFCPCTAQLRVLAQPIPRTNPISPTGRPRRAVRVLAPLVFSPPVSQPPSIPSPTASSHRSRLASR